MLDTVTSQVFQRACLMQAGALLPVALATVSNAIFFISLHMAIIDFSVALADGSIEELITDLLGIGVAACLRPTPCYGSGFGGPGGGMTPWGPGGPGGPLSANPVAIGYGYKIRG